MGYGILSDMSDLEVFLNLFSYYLMPNATSITTIPVTSSKQASSNILIFIIIAIAAILAIILVFGKKRKPSRRR